LAGAAGLGAAAFGLAGCAPAAPAFDESAPLTDGVFVGESSADGDGAHGRVTLTVAEGEIVASEYVSIEADGTLKGEDHGKDSSGQIANRAAYRAAQKAVAAFDVYARSLLEVGVPSQVEAVSGATIAYRQFLEAATEALTASQEGRPASPAPAASSAATPTPTP
jgi:major membrane immunogen (membrane-anchored lipoprotein)